MKKSLFILFLLVSSFVFAQQTPVEVPVIGVKVPIGESVSLKDVSIKFVEVLEDSRCPKFTTCIWAGRARVLVEVTVNGKTEKEILIFGEVKSGEEESTNLYSSVDFAINGLAVNPYPSSENPEKITDYELLICEGKNN